MAFPQRSTPRPWPALLLALCLLAAGVAVVMASRPAQASEDPAPFIVRKDTYYRSADGSVAVDEEVSTVSAQYVVNVHRWDASAIPVPVRYNNAGQPAEYGMANLIQNDIATWNAVTPSSFSFAWAGGGSGDVGSCGQSINLDGQNTIKFEPLPGITLGQTCTVWNPNQGANAKLVEFDMQLDNDVNTWSSNDQPQTGRYDLASTVLHELGHAAGLGHSGQSTAVMYPSLPNGVAKRTLTADDISGLQSAYPAVVTPTTPTTAAPSPTATSTPTPTPTPTSGTTATTEVRARTLSVARD